MSTLRPSKSNAGAVPARAPPNVVISSFRQKLMSSTRTTPPSTVASKQAQGGKNANGANAGKDGKSEASSKAAQQIAALEKKQVEILEEKKTVVDENEALKKKVAALEAILEEERENAAKLSAWRLRTLKTQNMELQKQLSSLKSSLTVNKKARDSLKKQVIEFQAKVEEFKAFDRIPEPKIKPEGSPIGAKKKVSGSPTLNRTGSPSSGRLSYPPATHSHSHSHSHSHTHTHKAATPTRSSLSSPQKTPSPSRTGNQRAGSPGSPAPRRSLSNTRLCQQVNKEDYVDGELDSPGVPPPTPKVAVEVSWLEKGEEWAKEVLESLNSTPVEILESESIAGVTVGGNNGAIDVALFQANVNPFLVGKKDEKEKMNEDKVTPEVTKEVLESLNFDKIHNLELQLAEIHPELSYVGGLLKNLAMPSLPLDTKENLAKEMESVNSKIYEAAKSLAQLALVVPGRSSLIGAEFEALDSTPSLLVKRESFTLREPPKVPSLDQFLALLPSNGEEGDSAAVVQELVNRIKSAEAFWSQEMKSLQEEMAFYQGCHAVNAAHVKTVAQSAREALQVVLGEAVNGCFAASEAIMQIMEALQLSQEEPSEENTKALLAEVDRGAPILIRFLQLLPDKLKLGKDDQVAAEATGELMDPVEKAYKDKLKEIFDKLQAGRNARYKYRNIASPSRSSAPSRTGSFRKN